jgi:hypothetical protein
VGAAQPPSFTRNAPRESTPGTFLHWPPGERSGFDGSYPLFRAEAASARQVCMVVASVKRQYPM